MQTWRNEEQIVEKLKKRHHTRLGVLQSLKWPSKGRGEKKLLQRGVFVFGHPSRYEPRQIGLNFIEQTRCDLKHISKLCKIVSITL